MQGGSYVSGPVQRAPFGIDQGRHQCKDWNRIEEWMKSRTVDIYQPGLLMHPEFGMHSYLALFGDEQLTHSYHALGRLGICRGSK